MATKGVHTSKPVKPDKIALVLIFNVEVVDLVHDVNFLTPNCQQVFLANKIFQVM